MRSTTLALVALLLLPGAVALPVNVPPTDELRAPHPPIRIVGDHGFRAGAAAGVLAGSGTADDPYVIANWIFYVPSAGGYVAAAPAGDDVAAIFLQATTAHVVIRNNVFLGWVEERPTGSDEGRVAVTSNPAIVLQSVKNVTVADNEFHDLGGHEGAVKVESFEGPLGVGTVGYALARTGAYLGPSRDVAITGNLFQDGNRPTIRVDNAHVRIEGNRVNVSSHNCCLAYGILMLEWLHDGSTVSGNHITPRIGAGFGSGSTAIRVTRGIVDGGTAYIEDNLIEGRFNGIEAGNVYEALWNGGRVEVRRNTVRVDWWCASVSAPGSVVEANDFAACKDGVLFPTSVRVTPDNRLRGDLMWQVVNLRDARLDAQGQRVGWFQAAGAAENVTLANFRVRAASVATLALPAGNVTIEGARFDGTTLRVGTGAHATVRATQFANASLAVDVRAAASGATIVGSAFEGVATGVRSAGPAVQATENWWGSATGPTAADNPGGTGARVEGPVAYSPWLAAPPF